MHSEFLAHLLWHLFHFHLLNTRSWNTGHKPRWDTKAVQLGVWRRSCQRCNSSCSFQCYQESRCQSAQRLGCAKTDIWLPLSLRNQHDHRNLSKNCFSLHISSRSIRYIHSSAIFFVHPKLFTTICQIGLATAYVLKALHFGRWVIVATNRFGLCSSSTLLSLKFLPLIFQAFDWSRGCLDGSHGLFIIYAGRGKVTKFRY